jgi:aspartyl/asparaginyl beta-hydroxylase (cupin superfamily)
MPLWRSRLLLPRAWAWLGTAARQRRGRARFSTQTATTTTTTTTTAGDTGGNAAGGNLTTNVVQGPSLLRTSTDRPNPSLIHLPGLRALPFWTQWNGTENRVAYQDKQVAFCVNHLQTHWETLREEYQSVSPKLLSDYDQSNDHLKLYEGNWDWHSYMLKGKIQGHFCAHFPQTTNVLQTLREEGLLFEGTPFGYAFFSTLYPHSKIAPHTSPMNFRLRIHLPLLVPDVAAGPSNTLIRGDGNDDDDDQKESPPPPCAIRVGPVTRLWNEGQALVLDDAYRHAVWNDTPHKRVLFLVDIWHPDVTLTERQEIVEMFARAAAQQQAKNESAPASAWKR